MTKLLTKSKYLLFLQCPKLLWINFNDSDLIPEIDEASQYLFDQGTLVGELATSLFPKGIFIKSDDFIGNIKKTKELLKEKKPLFEAGFMFDNIFSRPDILDPKGDEWDIIEVKSSTEVKDINIQDVSFQKYCYEKCGLKIRKCFLMHINNEYVRKGKLEPKKLFKLQDITEEVREAIKGIQERIDQALKIISQKKRLEKGIGPHCKKPYVCALYDECWGFLPKNSVFNLYRGGKKSFNLFEEGIVCIKDIPDEYKLTTNQQIQHECEKTGKPYIHKEGIKHFLKELEYPLYFLDFETYNTAIPLYDGLKPYQQVVFQFSLHVQEKPEAEIKHYSFLAEGDKDPRPKFMSELKKLLGTKGSVIVYNQSFEKARLKECGEFLKEYKDWIEGINARIIDLLIPFRNFHYYNPKQQGSASIKKVLPALTGKSYEGMEIAQGGDASMRYFYITHGHFDGRKETPEEIKKVRDALEKYCELDTWAEVIILEKLKEVVGK